MMSYTYGFTQIGRYVYSTHTLRNDELVNLGYELDRRSYVVLEKLRSRSKRGYMLYYNERLEELYVSRVQSVLYGFGWNPVVADIALRVANNYGYLTQISGRGYDPLALAAATVFYAQALCAARGICRQYPRAALFWKYSSRASFYRALRILVDEVGFTEESYKLILRGYRVVKWKLMRVVEHKGSGQVTVYVPRSNDIARIHVWIEEDILVIDKPAKLRYNTITIPRSANIVLVELVSPLQQ